MPSEPMICDTAGALAVSPHYAHPNAWLLIVIGGRLSLVLDVSSTSDHRAHLTRGIAMLRFAEPDSAGYVRIA